MIGLLGGVIIGVTLVFIGLWFALLWLYDQLRNRYQARRKHVLHTTAADERVFPRTGPPAGDKAQREAAYAELRALPAPGLDYISDRNVVLPRTPQAGDLSPFTPGPVAWTPPAHALEAVSKRYPAPVDGATPAPAEAAADPAPPKPLPAWVIEALNGHDGVDAAVDSIVARAVTP